MLPTIVARGTTAGLVKGAIEATQGLVSGIEGDIDDFGIGRGEESLGVGKPVLGGNHLGNR